MAATDEDRLERLFAAAAALPPARRGAFLARACGTDVRLRATLEALTAHAEAAHDFVDRVAGPAVARATGVLLDGAPAAPGGADPLVGRRVGHFRVEAPLGGGGMGRVYRAVDVRLDRTVALKFLPPHLGADADAKQRFVHEARAASALDHPSICAVHEIGETDAGELFIAMAYCPGGTLRQRIARGPLPVAEALDHAVQMAEGLQRAHDAGIVHRDVKPANVMVTDAGRLRLVDFGLAKIVGADVTRPGATMGTIAYMSPEQTRGEDVDARADVWSVGAVLYEMLTGRRPFRCDDPTLLVEAIRHDEPPPIRDARAGVPDAVAAVVARCLAKEPARRYPHAGALLADLRTVQAGGAVRHPEQRTRYLRQGRYARYGGAAVAAALLLLAGRAQLARPAAAVDSLAVLPVRAATGDAAQQAFADEMTGLLITDLSQLAGLRRVISRASVMTYRDTRKSSRQIGRELAVDALVETSVLRTDGRVRMDVRLIAADAERVAWSRSFERPMRDVLTLPREVAQSIARELRVQVTAGEAARLDAAARPVDPAAFALYLQAARTEAPRAGMALLEQAIARDSTFALAHARLAVAYVMLDADGARAERAIARALALQPSLSDAYDALGLLRMWRDWDWPAAEAALRRAIALNPHNSRAHHELGQLLMRLARCDEAVAAEQRAVLESPGIAHFQSGLAEVHLFCRRYAQAIREFERTLAIPHDSTRTFRNLGDAYFYQGEHARALAMYRASGRVPGWAYLPSGSAREARAQIDSLTTAWADGAGPRHLTFALARLHTSLGERDRALAWLERAYEAREGQVVYLGVHPHFDALRGEPRFRALLAQVGLPR